MFFKVFEFILYDSKQTKNIKTYQTTSSIIFGKHKLKATYFFYNISEKNISKESSKTRFKNIYV